MSAYSDMLPPKPIDGKRGYYPVCTKEEWDELPEIYKVMEWIPVKDPLNGNKMSGITGVVFDVTFLEPYNIGNVKVEVHPQDMQKILFCLFSNVQCHLYSVCQVVLDSGSRVNAKWYQDSVTGAFGIYTMGVYAGKQGGFKAYIPKSCKLQEDGTYKYNWHPESNLGVSAYYTFSNPFD